ncbi:(d)CMP kinase [bacterium]|nr:MAG: (d)CMP kinase [bacterium]
MKRKPVIAIDGPAGAGKSTVSRRLAEELGLTYLDTGAMYRTLALKTIEAEIPPEDAVGVERLLGGIEIGFNEGGEATLDGESVADAIRTVEVAERASSVSIHPAVRRLMVERQQALVGEGGVVLEGRDATTVIAPNAQVKIYLTASLEERARRRTVDFAAQGKEEAFGNVREQIEQRDHRDITRSESPLKVADDATVVDSANMTIDEVVARIAEIYHVALVD